MGQRPQSHYCSFAAGISVSNKLFVGGVTNYEREWFLIQRYLSPGEPTLPCYVTGGRIRFMLFDYPVPSRRTYFVSLFASFKTVNSSIKTDLCLFDLWTSRPREIEKIAESERDLG